MKSKAISLDDVKTACEELAEMGLLQDTGLRRNGQVVWELSPLGKLFAQDRPENKQQH